MNGGAAVLALLDGEAAVERRRALLDRDERRSSALALAVVGDDRLEAALGRLANLDRDAGRRAAANRLVQGLADDLVQTDLAFLGEALGVVDVDVDLHLVLETELLRELLDR